MHALDMLLQPFSNILIGLGLIRDLLILVYTDAFCFERPYHFSDGRLLDLLLFFWAFCLL